MFAQQFSESFLGVAGSVLRNGVLLPNETSVDPVVNALTYDPDVFRVAKADVLELLSAVLAALFEPVCNI